MMAVALAVALVMGIALLAARPADRRTVRNWLLLLGACALAELASPWLREPMVDRAAVLLSGLVVVRFAAMLLFRIVAPIARVRPARIVEELAIAGLFAAWAMAWLRMAGVDFAGLVATSAVVTAILAFSMQETLGNVLGGIVLQVDDSVSAGDWVRVDDVSGRVVGIGWRHTAILTRSGETVVVPNGWLMKNRFTVIGSRDNPGKGWRRTVLFHVDWAAPPAAVCKALERSCTNAGIPHVADDPPPTAVLIDATASYGRYHLRYWLTDPAADDPTDSRVRMHALAALQRHGFRIGMAQEERIIVKDNEAHREAQAAREHARRVEALARVELFAALTDAERDALANHLVYAPFVAGDIMTRQGDVAHWLYLVIEGDAQVVSEGDSGREVVNTLGAGSVFGEMGLLTGAPRRATVAARTDVTCYRLDKAGLETILKARPDIAETMAKVLSARETALAQHFGARPGSAQADSHAGAILARMRRFFGIEEKEAWREPVTPLRG